MILAVDIGNTNITLGGFEADEIRFISRITTHKAKTEDEFAICILKALGLHGVEKERSWGSLWLPWFRLSTMP